MEWGPVCMCPGHPPLSVPDGLPSEIKPQSSFCSATNVGAGPHPSYRVTLGNIFCSVICFSYTEHPFTSILAECGSGCPSTLPSAYASPLLAPSPPPHVVHALPSLHAARLLCPLAAPGCSLQSG